MFFNLHIFVIFFSPQLSSSWFLVSYACGQKRCLIWFQSSLIYWSLFSVPTYNLILGNVACTLEKNVCSTSLGIESSVNNKSIWSYLSFKGYVFLPPFRLGDLFVGISGMLKSQGVFSLHCNTKPRWGSEFIENPGTIILMTLLFLRILCFAQ